MVKLSLYIRFFYRKVFHGKEILWESVSWKRKLMGIQSRKSVHIVRDKPKCI